MKLIQSTDRLIQQFQNNVRVVLEPIEHNLITQGTYLNNISLTSGVTNVVPTNLNRILTGWMLTRVNASTTVWDSQNLNTTPTQNLQLHCSSSCIVSLYVF